MGPRHEPQELHARRGWRSIPGMLLVLASAACVSLPPQQPGSAASGPIFSPESFFEGKTEGTGTVRIVASGHHAIHVLGAGRIETDGALLLDQLVDEEGKLPKQREWRIRQISPGHFTGTLTDAAGPVTGELAGNLLHLRFPMVSGLAAEQRLYLQPDHRTVINRMTIRKLGVVVAVLIETIHKVG